MNKKVAIVSSVFVMLLFLVTVMYCGNITKADTVSEDVIAEIAINTNKAKRSIGRVYSNDDLNMKLNADIENLREANGIFPKLTSEDVKADSIANYGKIISKLMVGELYEKTLNNHENYLFNHAEYDHFIVSDEVFDYKICDFKIEDRVASIVLDIEGYQKKMYDYGNEVKVFFPVSKEKINFNLVQEGNIWKVSGYKIISYLFDGDKEKEKSFATIDEAYLYLTDTIPDNLFRDVVVE